MSKNMGKNPSGKYSENVLDHATKSAADALKTASKSTKATGDLIGNKIPHKIANNSSENNLDTVSRTEKSTEIPIWKITEKIAKTFEGGPTISFKQTRNLREIIDGNTIINSNVKITTTKNMNGKCRPCNGKESTMSWREVNTTTSFTSYKNKNTFIVLPVRANIWYTLWSMFYASYSMWKDLKHHLIYALITADLTIW